MPRIPCLLLTVLTMTSLTLSASAQDASETVHDELRTFRERIVAAILADDVATQMELAHPDIVTMWQDGRVVQGHEGLKALLDELGTGADRGFLGYAQEPTSLDLTAVYDGRFGFAHGTSVAQYNLFGMRFDLTNYWTAALLKEDDQWRLVGYHVSGDISDNPLLNAAKQSVYLGATLAGGAGLVIGLFIGRRFGRRCAQAANA